MNKYITEEGAKELQKQDREYHEAILANATLIRQKEGRASIDENHIRRASKIIISEQNSRIKWVITISCAILVGLALFQISIIYPGFDPYLLILPSFSILWVIVVAYVFRDFL